MLSGDPTVGGGAAAFTVEGWVKLATPKGGYILSTNHLSASGRRVSTLSLVANATHIIVGHEREGRSSLPRAFSQVFPTGVNLTDRWSHLALVRTLEAADSIQTRCSNQISAATQRAVCLRIGTTCKSQSSIVVSYSTLGH